MEVTCHICHGSEEIVEVTCDIRGGKNVAVVSNRGGYDVVNAAGVANATCADGLALVADRLLGELTTDDYKIKRLKAFDQSIEITESGDKNCILFKVPSSAAVATTVITNGGEGASIKWTQTGKTVQLNAIFTPPINITITAAQPYSVSPITANLPATQLAPLTRLGNGLVQVAVEGGVVILRVTGPDVTLTASTPIAFTVVYIAS